MSRLSQVIQNWNGIPEDSWFKYGFSEAHASLDIASTAHNSAVFKAFFDSSSSSSALPPDAVTIAAVAPAANESAIRSWREGGNGRNIQDKCLVQAPPYASMLSGYLLSAASAAAAGASATDPVVSQLAALARTAPTDVFRKFLSQQSKNSSSSSSGGSSSSSGSSSSGSGSICTDSGAVLAFAAATGARMPQHFSLVADPVMHADRAENMGELGAGLVCLQQLRGSNTSAKDAQSFYDQALKMWSHSGVLLNYLNVTAAITNCPPSRMRMPATSPEDTSDAWWLPDVASTLLVVTEDSMWKSEWPELLGSSGTSHSWAAAVRCATTKSGDPTEFSPWKEEGLVSDACAELISGNMPNDLVDVGGVVAVAEHLISGASGRMPLVMIDALVAELDVMKRLGKDRDSGGFGSDELLCDLICNIIASDVDGNAAGFAINCSEWIPTRLSLEVLSYAISLYPSESIASANVTSAAPLAATNVYRQSPTPTLFEKDRLSSNGPDVLNKLTNRYMVIALRNMIASRARPMSSTRLKPDIRSFAEAAVTSCPELLSAALALVVRESPDGADIATSLRKLAFDEYKKNNDDSVVRLVRLLETECDSFVAAHEHANGSSQNASNRIADALSLCVGVLGKPADLSSEHVDSDVELALIESVRAFCDPHLTHFSQALL